MKKLFIAMLPALLLAACGRSSNQDSEATDTTHAQHAAAQPPAVIVTAGNFNTSVEHAGGIGAFHHFRELMPIDNQSVIRAYKTILDGTWKVPEAKPVK